MLPILDKWIINDNSSSNDGVFFMGPLLKINFYPWFQWNLFTTDIPSLSTTSVETLNIVQIYQP
jgi:hypothetical protein